jgi:hypothetical protein
MITKMHGCVVHSVGLIGVYVCETSCGVSMLMHAVYPTYICERSPVHPKRLPMPKVDANWHANELESQLTVFLVTATPPVMAAAAIYRLQTEKEYVTIVMCVCITPGDLRHGVPGGRQRKQTCDTVDFGVNDAKC